jgi:hypothetical protein
MFPAAKLEVADALIMLFCPQGMIEEAAYILFKSPQKRLDHELVSLFCCHHQINEPEILRPSILLSRPPPTVE